MFQKSIEAIIAQGVKGLEALKREAAATADEAQLQIQRCQSEIQSLVNLGKQVPEKVFDRYGHVMVSTFEIHDEHYGHFEIRIGNTSTNLRGLMGDEIVKRGKYRAIVLLEKIS